MGRIDYIGVVFLSLFGVVGLSEAQLQQGFYAKSCPRAEKIVLDYVNKHIHNGPSLAASFLRMHFHDCFVRVSTIFHLLEVCIKILSPFCILFLADARFALHLRAVMHPCC